MASFTALAYPEADTSQASPPTDTAISGQFLAMPAYVPAAAPVLAPAKDCNCYEEGKCKCDGNCVCPIPDDKQVSTVPLREEDLKPLPVPPLKTPVVEVSQVSDYVPIEITVPGVVARKVTENGKLLKVVIEREGTIPTPPLAPQAVSVQRAAPGVAYYPIQSNTYNNGNNGGRRFRIFGGGCANGSCR
jgi:hypothetical protein